MNHLLFLKKYILTRLQIIRRTWYQLPCFHSDFCWRRQSSWQLAVCREHCLLLKTGLTSTHWLKIDDIFSSFHQIFPIYQWISISSHLYSSIPLDHSCKHTFILSLQVPLYTSPYQISDQRLHTDGDCWPRHLEQGRQEREQPGQRGGWEEWWGWQSIWSEQWVIIKTCELHSLLFQCNICLDVARDAVVSMCGHLFCWPCLHQVWLKLVLMIEAWTDEY